MSFQTAGFPACDKNLISAAKIYKISPVRLKTGFPAVVGVKASDLELACNSQHRLQLLLGHLVTNFSDLELSLVFKWFLPELWEVRAGKFFSKYQTFMGLIF